jgi:hypothetical protein
VVDALDGNGIGGASIRVESTILGTSDATGQFTLQHSPAGRYRLTFTGQASVERQTNVAIPGPHVTVSLIPAAFDLPSFDQMFRSSELQRWTAAPALTVLARAMTFTALTDAEFVAAGDVMSDADIDVLIADLRAALQALSGDRFGDFSARTVETASRGARVSVQRAGQIVVGRYEGLERQAGFPGYTRWAIQLDGAVAGASVLLDGDFDRGGGPLRRALRMHELGHGLGCNHVVTGRPSVMTPEARSEPTAWDRQAASVAFDRPPGNRTPDVDPAAFSANVAPSAVAAPIAWGPAVR